MLNCRCPYCGKEVSYFKGMSIRRQGEYYCPKCHKESNVYIKRTIWVCFLAVVIFALIILGFYLFMTNRENLLFILFVMIPFLIFFLVSPAFVRLRPMKKFQDSLYDTEMVNATAADPDPTMASTAPVAPAFMDEEDFRPVIDPNVFNAIKEERRAIENIDGGTKSFDRFENISSSDSMGHTRPVGDLKSIGKKPETSGGRHFDFSEFD